jgi:hypothetical protein
MKTGQNGVSREYLVLNAIVEPELLNVNKVIVNHVDQISVRDLPRVCADLIQGVEAAWQLILLRSLST